MTINFKLPPVWMERSGEGYSCICPQCGTICRTVNPTGTSAEVFCNECGSAFRIEYLRFVTEETKEWNEPAESKTPALDRGREARYEQCTDGTCTCLDCRYSRTAEYAGGGTKFVCDKLNIQTYKCAWCRHFKLKRKGVSNESVCRD